MVALMAKNWWLFLVRGIAAIAFGILALIWPGITLVTLVFFFGAYALVDGISNIIAAVRGDPGTRGHGWTVAILGAISVVAGVIAFVYPGITALALLYVIAAWALVAGVMEIYTAYRLRREITNEWWMALGGVASIVFGILLIAFPGTGILSLLILLGAFAIAFGVTQIVLAFRLRGLRDQTGPTPNATSPA
jgi:uncharacterized membrane protein HdeD (DUF308 family)